MMSSNTKERSELANEEYNNIMSASRVIEPFSPTFEHPDDFLPSNQTSYRPMNLKTKPKHQKKISEPTVYKPISKMFKKASAGNGTKVDAKHKAKLSKTHHNRTYSSNAETVDAERAKALKYSDPFKETGKFISPLNESTDLSLNRTVLTKRNVDPKNATTRRKRRPKTGNGRYSRKSKAKTKSEDRTDRKRIYSKSVEQSYHERPGAAKGSNFSPDLDTSHKVSRVNEEEFFNVTDEESTSSSKRVLNNTKEHETLRIIEQILKEEANFAKKEELQKLNNDVRKTNRLKHDLNKKKQTKTPSESQRLNIKAYKELKKLNKSKDKNMRK